VQLAVDVAFASVAIATASAAAFATEPGVAF